ncbi:MAG: ribonuclease III [Dehalococcoidia bacterium]|nr:ribonuclease III [Dehalococcoidia bacterium]
MTELDRLQESLGVIFDDVSHLELALVHRSYLNEAGDCHPASNERLEFLGDAVLGFVVARKLYSDFPGFSEGDLTKLRSSLVRTETLARIAHSLQLGDYLYLGKGEEESGGRNRERNLACTLEAVIGAVLIDRGFGVAKRFVLRILREELRQAAEGKLQNDPKSKLQEVIQAGHRVTPTYRTIDATGPDHERVFTVEVFAGETLLGRGSGRKKRIAEQEAARDALRNLEGEENIA